MYANSYIYIMGIIFRKMHWNIYGKPIIIYTVGLWYYLYMPYHCLISHATQNVLKCILRFYMEWGTIKMLVLFYCYPGLHQRDFPSLPVLVTGWQQFYKTGREKIQSALGTNIKSDKSSSLPPLYEIKHLCFCKCFCWRVSLISFIVKHYQQDKSVALNSSKKLQWF